MLTKEQKQEFISLAYALEPENLYCDGERSESEATVVYTQLIKKWKALQKKAGVIVNRSEPFDWE